MKPNLVDPSGLITRTSDIHRTGCYTNIAIRKGTHIIEYLGDILTVEEADERYPEQEETYLFGLTDGKHVQAKLGSLVASYRKWIDSQKAKVPASPKKRRETAEELLKRAKVAANRMGGGAR